MTDGTSWMRFVSAQIDSLLITSDQLDIEFTVKGSNSSDANTAEISIFNLSRKTRDKIKADQEVLLKAGYVGDVGTVFTGKIKTISETRDQGELQTKILVLTKGYATGIPAVKYPDGTPLRTIIENALRASEITPEKIDDQGFPLESDYTSDTNAGAVLEYCAKLINGSKKPHKTAAYYIEGNAGYFVTDDYSRDAVVLSAETGLIETLPEDPGDGRFTRSIRSGLNHRIRVDSYIDLRSLSTGATGTYKVVEYVHKYEGTEYTTECKVKPL